MYAFFGVLASDISEQENLNTTLITRFVTHLNNDIFNSLLLQL